MNFTRFVMAVLALGLCGCATKNTAVFVTSTSLSILEGDTKPAGISIGYKRVEGYLGPNNASGSAPPVLASIESDAKMFNPKIRQLYATGNAAIIAASGKGDPSTKVKLDDRKLMFFGTSTSIGISIGTTTSVPDSFAFGYKRKEFSMIPLVATTEGGMTYPSVLASIDTTGEVGKRASKNAADGNQNAASVGQDGTGLKTSQFFATGKSADAMAIILRDEFVIRAQQSVGDAQRVEAGDAIACYSRVRLNDRRKVWNDAGNRNLYHEPDNSEKGTILGMLEAAFEQAVDGDTVVNPDQLYRADSVYARSVFIPAEKNPERLTDLAAHRAYVCVLSTLNQREEDAGNSN